MPNKIAYEYTVEQEHGQWFVFRKEGRLGQWEKHSEPKSSQKQALNAMNRELASIPLAREKK
jgi:hypothetical protein